MQCPDDLHGKSTQKRLALNLGKCLIGGKSQLITKSMDICRYSKYFKLLKIPNHKPNIQCKIHRLSYEYT